MLLSIITVNYNDRAGLERTIRSVLSQKSHDYEWIVIDGGSTDGSRELIEQYAEHITYWVSEPDRGVYHAMNKGVDVAKGEYLQFLNSGDEFFDSDAVGDFIATDPQADIVCGNEVIVDGAGREVRRSVVIPDPLTLTFFWHNTPSHQGSFFSRRCFESLRYNETHKINSDEELFITLLYRGYTFCGYDRYVVRFNNEGISQRPESKMLRDAEFNESLHRVIPAGILTDIKEVLQNRDVDIYRLCHDIVNSNKAVRYLTRIFLYPIAWIARMAK